ERAAGSRRSRRASPPVPPGAVGPAAIAEAAPGAIPPASVGEGTQGRVAECTERGVAKHTQGRVAESTNGRDRLNARAAVAEATPGGGDGSRVEELAVGCLGFLGREVRSRGESVGPFLDVLGQLGPVGLACLGPCYRRRHARHDDGARYLHQAVENALEE